MKKRIMATKYRDIWSFCSIAVLFIGIKPVGCFRLVLQRKTGVLMPIDASALFQFQPKPPIALRPVKERGQAATANSIQTNRHLKTTIVVC